MVNIRFSNLNYNLEKGDSLIKFDSSVHSKLLEYFCSSIYLKARIQIFQTLSDVKKYAKFTILYSPNFLFDTTFACNQRQMLEWYSTYCKTQIAIFNFISPSALENLFLKTGIYHFVPLIPTLLLYLSSNVPFFPTTNATKI